MQKCNSLEEWEGEGRREKGEEKEEEEEMKKNQRRDMKH